MPVYSYERFSDDDISHLTTMLQLSGGSEQIMLDIIENKENLSGHTVWIASTTSEVELRIASMAASTVIISRVCVGDKRRGHMTKIFNYVKSWCINYSISKIVMQAVGTPEMAAWCEKNKFKPNPYTSFEFKGKRYGDWEYRVFENLRRALCQN